jgi:hypothetical protein
MVYNIPIYTKKTKPSLPSRIILEALKFQIQSLMPRIPSKENYSTQLIIVKRFYNENTVYNSIFI